MPTSKREPITLATLPDASTQEVFDQVARHLLTQGDKAVTGPEDDCRYRAGELCCAAGCLIADDEYRENAFEGLRWTALARSGQVPSEHSELIRELQRVHDGSAPSTWGKNLRRVAHDHDLSPSVLKEFDV